MDACGRNGRVDHRRFLLTRSTGLPGFPDNVGNWEEPLGLASLWVESLVLVLSVYEVVTTPSMKDVWAH